MSNSAEMSQLTSALSRVTSIPHVYDETLETRGGGPTHCKIECGGMFFLSWFDEDTQEMVISPLNLWDVDDIQDLMADPTLPLLRYQASDREGFERMAAQTLAASALPAVTTH